MRAIRCAVAAAAVASVAILSPSAAGAASARESKYKGWKSIALKNDLIELQVVPDVGRVMQYSLGDSPFLWVNEKLAGKKPPLPNGVGPEGEWMNYGGDKLWPAPQGWGGDDKWAGPPGPLPATEGLPNKWSILESKDKSAAVRMTGPEDKNTGIQFSREIKVFDGSTRVGFKSTMKNTGGKPRRWGIWQVTQNNAANRDGGMNEKLQAYCPINPKSRYPRGFKIMFGLVNNPTFQADRENGLMRLHYKRFVGKIGMDCSAGWLAIVNGADGKVFVTRFKHQPDKQYPDGASVEFWSQGRGQIITGDDLVDMPEDVAENPHLIESEILSPFADLKPGESYSFNVDWYAANIGGDYPILDCTDVGVVCEPLQATHFKPHIGGAVLSLRGRFGVFHKGRIALSFLDKEGDELKRIVTEQGATPEKPLDLSSVKKWDFNVQTLPRSPRIAVLFVDNEGRTLGELARGNMQWLIE